MALLASFVFGTLPGAASAADATLFLSPVTAQYTVGETVTIRAKLSSGGALVNAVGGTLRFEPKEFAIERIGLEHSVITSWTEKPVAPEGSNSISFAGIMATGTVIDQGELFALNLRPLRSGELSIWYDQGAAILAADGTGGNIVSTLNRGLYAIVPKDITPEIPPEAPIIPAGTESTGSASTSPALGATSSGEVLGVTTEERLVSSTHPDQNKWYATTTAHFSWKNEKGMTRLLLGAGKKPAVNGSVSYDPFITDKTIPDLDDGTWYFHITKWFENGDEFTEHYRINVDTRPPKDLAVIEVERADKTDPRLSFTVTATDTTSGVDHYAFRVDNGEPADWRDDGSHLYTVAATEPGEHTIHAEVFDGAGNSAGMSVVAVVDPIPPPTLLRPDEKLREGKPLIFEVSSLPGATVSVVTSGGSSGPVTETVTTDSYGKAQYTSTFKLLPGPYRAVAIATDARGATSKESPPLEFVARRTIGGLIARHPFIPYASLGLAILVIISVFAVRRFRRGELFGRAELMTDNDLHGDTAAFAGEQSQSPASLIQEKNTKRVSGGTIILQERQRSRGGRITITL